MATNESCSCCGSESATPSTDDVTCYCPLDGVIDTVGRKYAMQVVAILGSNGPTRFGDLEERLAVTSSSTLSGCLSDLVDEDLVERRSFDEIPPRVEYSLTPRGRELEERLQPLLEWASRVDG